mmetsp:Transcript_43032/g.97894  ORF Transcript_43032/g.97894 Transcript_43032/m.97894 type:complete len:328 (+) Transcript_43032:172-1155(+)
MQRRAIQALSRYGVCASRQFSSKAPDRQIGFIGLGNMGAAMAVNLAKAHKSVILQDVNAKAVERICSKVQGGLAAATPAELAGKADTIITMLPSSPHVHEVYLGANGILSTVRPGSLLIDCSTISPETARLVAQKVAEKGGSIDFVDAPVSGGTIGAENATLTFMVGGPDAAFLRAQEVLAHMGKSIVHCGGPGNGQVAKLCNNLLLGITMAGVSEAFNLGEKLGIDPKILAGVINSSSGRSWSSDTYNPCPGVMEGVPSSRGYTGGFACDLMIKDLGLASSAASLGKTPLPLGAAAQQLYSLMSAQGNGHLDFSGVYTLLQQKPKK